MLRVLKSVHTVLQHLIHHHCTPYIVGGYVRDALLRKESKDIDVEVYGVENLEALFLLLKDCGTLNSVGKSFGILKLSLEDIDIDFSLPRRDSKVSSGHQGFEISIAPSLSFKEAASRRDFTINAMGYNYKTKKLEDPFHGYADLEAKVLQAVDERTFTEDPLRIYRAVGFASRFELSISEALFKLLSQMIEQKLHQELAPERILEEYKKLFLKSPYPSIGVKLLQKLHLSNLEFSTPQRRDQNLEAVDALARSPRHEKSLMLMICALCFKIENRDTFLLSFVQNGTLHQEILHYLTYAELFFQHRSFKNYDLYTLAKDVKLSLLLELCAVLSPNTLQKEQMREIKRRAISLNIYTAPLAPLIQGRDLIAQGLKPSKAFKMIIENCYEAQISEQFFDKKSALQYLQKLL